MAEKKKTKKTAQSTEKSNDAHAAQPKEDTRHPRRRVSGLVVSNKMDKTIVVRLDRRVRHTLYKKYVVRSRKVKVHDEKNDAHIGDLVTIVEARPMSKEKRWALQKIVRRSKLPESAAAAVV